MENSRQKVTVKVSALLAVAFAYCLLNALAVKIENSHAVVAFSLRLSESFACAVFVLFFGVSFYRLAIKKLHKILVAVAVLSELATLFTSVLKTALFLEPQSLLCLWLSFFHYALLVAVLFLAVRLTPLLFARKNKIYVAVVWGVALFSLCGNWVQLLAPRFWDLAVSDCVALTVLLKVTLELGVVPTVSVYAQVLEATTLPLQLLDKKGVVCYNSANPIKNAEGSKLQALPVTAGSLLYQSDVAKYDHLALRLAETREEIGEENVLLQAEIEVKGKRSQADEKNRLYDRITNDVVFQLEAIDNLLSTAEKCSGDGSKIWAKICMLGAYVKRYGNLLLLSENNSSIPAKELEFCIRESMDNLALSKIYVAFDSFCEGKQETKHIITVYNLCQNLVERFYDEINAIMINLKCKNGDLKINIQIGFYHPQAEAEIASLKPQYGDFEVSLDEQDAIINFHIKGGGDRNA